MTTDTGKESALKAPFPYIGGKSRIAPIVWLALGDVYNYIEPFAGSIAVLLARPKEHFKRQPIETVNDADGLLANFWRAMVHAPEGVIQAAENPVNECDLHARHLWLVGQRERITERLMGDPEWCDPKAAGWWAWGLSCWIGGWWCSGRGPWGSVDGILTKTEHGGITRGIPYLGGWQGINRQFPRMEDATVTRQRYWLETLVERLRYVRVTCGDWSRVVTSTTALFPQQGARGKTITGVVLDPPYQVGADYYATPGGTSIQQAVEDWCRSNGENPRLRIALCGYEGEYTLPGWRIHAWETGGGYAKKASVQGAGAHTNAKRERVWLSPHCLPTEKAPSRVSPVDLLTSLEDL